MGAPLGHLTHINPLTLSDSLAVGYSQVIVAKPGKLVILAGQVGWDTKNVLAGDGSFGAQVRKAMDNVSIALSEAGASGKDVVHMKYFIIGLTDERVGELSAALREAALFDYERPPTGTLLGVERLAREELLVEIEAIAVISE